MPSIQDGRPFGQKVAEFCHIRGLASVKQLARLVISQIAPPKVKEKRLFPEFPEKTDGPADSLQKRPKEDRRITETFPVAFGASRVMVQGLHIKQVMITLILVPPKPARIGLAVLGIDKKEIHAAVTTVAQVLAFLVLFFKGIQRGQRRKYPHPRTVLRHNL